MYNNIEFIYFIDKKPNPTTKKDSLFYYKLKVTSYNDDRRD